MELTPQEFLAQKGLDLKQTKLLTVVDGDLVVWNLCDLMEQYHKTKVYALDLKIIPDLETKITENFS